MIFSTTTSVKGDYASGTTFKRSLCFLTSQQGNNKILKVTMVRLWFRASALSNIRHSRFVFNPDNTTQHSYKHKFANHYA